MGNAISGEVGFPVYLEDRHKCLLDSNIGGGTLDEPLIDAAYTVNVLDTINEMYVDLAGTPDYTRSPFYTAVAYDPDADLANTTNLANQYYPLLQSFDPTITFDQLVTAATSVVSENLLSQDKIDAAVAAFDENTKQRHLRNITRVTGSFFNLRAVMTTQFGIELALLESRRAAEVNNFEQSLVLQNDGLRVSTLANILQIGVGLYDLQHSAWARALTIQDGLTKTNIEAKTNQLANDIHYDVQDTMWDLTLLERQANLLAGLNTAPTVREPLTRFEKFLAAAGSALSILGPVIGLLA